MTAIICIAILAYYILGKDIKGVIEKIGNVDWKRKAVCHQGRPRDSEAIVTVLLCDDR